MANEVRLHGCLQYEDAQGAADSLDYADDLATSTNLRYNKCIHYVGTSEEAMKLGEVSSLGWCVITNHDTTNFVQVRTATSGTAMIKVPAGCSVGPFYFGSGVTAPYIIADTAECKTEYLIVSA